MNKEYEPLIIDGKNIYVIEDIYKENFIHELGKVIFRGHDEMGLPRFLVHKILKDFLAINIIMTKTEWKNYISHLDTALMKEVPNE